MSTQPTQPSTVTGLQQDANKVANNLHNEASKAADTVMGSNETNRTESEEDSDGFVADPNGGVPNIPSALEQAKQSGHSGAAFGRFVPRAKERLNNGNFEGVGAPLVVGLIIMMWPILTGVRYERLPGLIRTRINWIIGPFMMLALAWATLPDLPDYRTGIIMVGIARCIAMRVAMETLAL
ncbi:arsenicals resistance [Malassezia japonica]|uniref:Arsenicals resistance n=1 Tax=Malassezia japonica TaxID=223818 RepID=A0AAF0EZN0_9BASI|nr:arsenicals resistance [Malassezia japonica]WFD37136.1 arsenicals resistance [Malassezia japonica]